MRTQDGQAIQVAIHNTEPKDSLGLQFVFPTNAINTKIIGTNTPAAKNESKKFRRLIFSQSISNLHLSFKACVLARAKGRTVTKGCCPAADHHEVDRHRPARLEVAKD